MLTTNTHRQLFFVITARASTRCLVENFQLICRFAASKCSGETVLAHCARKRRLQRKMTKEYHWIGAKDNIDMFSKLLNDRNSFIYLSLFKRQARPMFNKLSHPRDD